MIIIIIIVATLIWGEHCEEKLIRHNARIYAEECKKVWRNR